MQPIIAGIEGGPVDSGFLAEMGYRYPIKFLILYITARVIEPIPFDTVWDLAMCDEGVDYTTVDFIGV